MRFAIPELRDLVQQEVAASRRDRLHVDVGVAVGCPHDPLFSVPKGPCYQFSVRGKPVPDPGNPGYATISFGILYIAVRAS